MHILLRFRCSLSSSVRRFRVSDGDIGVAVTGDNNQVVLTRPVRSAYWEQVRRIAPRELIDRDRELTDLAAFWARPRSSCSGSGPDDARYAVA